MAIGKNRNRSYIPKETVDNALSSMDFIPVVAHLKYDSKNNKYYVGGHDIEFVTDKDGYLIKRDLTVPFGCVLPNTASYEQVIEKDGTENIYLVCDIIIWSGRYPKLLEAKYSDDILFNQSIEIKIKKGEPWVEDNSYYHIKEMIFSAFCLLGKSDDTSSEYHTEPCFPSASVVSYEHDKEVFEQMLQEFKLALKEHLSLVIKDEDVTSDKEDGDMKYKDNVIVDETVANDVVDTTAVDTTADAGAIEFANVESSMVSEPEVNQVADFKLMSNILDGLRNALREFKITSEGGYEYHRYYMVDVDFDKSEVYFYDKKDDGLYGAKYAVNGDVVSIDFETKTRKLYAIVDFEDTQPNENVFSAIVNANISLGDKNIELQKTIAAFEAKFKEYEVELDELRKFKENTIATEELAKKNAVFEKWSALLAGNEQFEALKENINNYTADELEKECKCVFADMQFSVVGKDESKGMLEVKFIKTDEETAPYGGLVEKYKKNKN